MTRNRTDATVSGTNRNRARRAAPATASLWPVTTGEGPAGPEHLAARLADVERSLLARWPESQIDPSLERIQMLMDLLGDPQGTYPVILVAGTNGKTSTARIIDSLLRSFGLRVGRFTSPHLTSVTERIALEGRPIEVERFLAAWDDVS